MRDLSCYNSISLQLMHLRLLSIVSTMSIYFVNVLVNGFLSSIPQKWSAKAPITRKRRSTDSSSTASNIPSTSYYVMKSLSIPYFSPLENSASRNCPWDVHFAIYRNALLFVHNLIYTFLNVLGTPIKVQLAYVVGISSRGISAINPSRVRDTPRISTGISSYRKIENITPHWSNPRKRNLKTQEKVT